MSKAKLDWTLFEKAAAAVKAASEPPSVGKPGDPNSGGTKSTSYHSNDPGLMFRQGRTNSSSHYSNQPQPKKPTRRFRRPAASGHSTTGWRSPEPDPVRSARSPLSLNARRSRKFLEFISSQIGAQARGDEDWNNVPDLLQRSPFPVPGYNPNLPR